MKKCPICDSPIGDNDYVCPTCKQRIHSSPRRETDFAAFPFHKSSSALMNDNEMSFMIVVDVLFVVAICVIGILAG